MGLLLNDHYGELKHGRFCNSIVIHQVVSENAQTVSNALTRTAKRIPKEVQSEACLTEIHS